MKLAIPKEVVDAEQRVALVPQLTQELAQLGCEILLEKGAGAAAFYADKDYHNTIIHEDVKSLYQNADIILKVQAPLEQEIALFKPNAVVIGLLAPLTFPQRVVAMRDQGLTSFALELLPRISRAQSMDVLSSQATIAGYKAVLLAANLSRRLFPMLTTAAGAVRPANVLVIGAGVAGLQAIATARRLGAVVKAYDIRPAAREQVESLGAKMIDTGVKAEASGGYARELTAEERQQQEKILKEAVAQAEVVITTALIPGKPAPKIITREMVAAMQPGAVITDIAAEAGGNCELTAANKIIEFNHVLIQGPVNLPSMVARDASNLYARNLVNFLKLILKEGQLNFDWEDPIIMQTVLTHAGVIKNQQLQDIIAEVKK